MSGYSKLDCGIIHSSVWQEPHDVRVAWITMLGLTDYYGHVRAAIPALANINGVTVQRMEEILEIFMSPDPYSRTPDNEGRRLMRAENGDWVVLNYPKYRDGLKQPDRTSAERKARQREREREEMSRQKRDSHGASRSGTAGHAYSDSDSDSDAKKDPSPGPADAGHGGEGASESKPSPSKPESWKTKPDPLAAYPRLLEAYPKIEKKILELHPHAKLPAPGTKQYFDSRQTLARLVSIDKHTESDVLSTLSWVVAKQQPGRDGFLWRDHFQSINGLRNITDGMTKFAKMQKSMQKAIDSPPKPAPGEDLPEYIRDAMKAAGKL